MSLPSSFKAAVVPTPGEQHVIQERSLGPLADDEVAVKITAAAINPVDHKVRDYVSIRDTTMPGMSRLSSYNY